MESIPDRQRHGPADVDFPPPGGPWKPLALNGRLVGWAETSGLALARRSAELGSQLADEHRAHLLGRLGHKLRSASLALQESARQAAFGRPELLETVFEQAQEVARRAAAVEAAAVQPTEGARGVVLGAVLNFALPGADRRLPPEASVLGSEPALVEAFTRTRDWMGDQILKVDAELKGSWWKVSVVATGPKQALPVPEMGEPLIRLIVESYLDGWFDTSQADQADFYLPAHQSR
jgi:hypothetical protein